MSVTVDKMPGSSSITRMGCSIMGSVSLACAIPRGPDRHGRQVGGSSLSCAVLRGCGGQSHMERAAAAGGAGDPDAPAMLLGNAPADEQPQAHPGEAPVVHVRAAVEALENVR